MTRSRSGRSSARSRRRPPRAPTVDVYLFPAVVGGGLGDIEEVLAAGRELAQSGFRPILYRRPGRPLPRSVDGPWDWPPLVRRSRIGVHAPAALTISAAWGVSAAPARAEPFGRGGPWVAECRDVEAAYGAGSVVHASLEEFARTLRSVAEDRERLREGGVPSRALADRLSRSRRSGDLARFREAFVRYRAFDRPNVLHLFATFQKDPGFAREFPLTVQTGPLWPRWPPPVAPRRTGRREWVWYASPSSAERIAPAVVAELGRADPPVRLCLRTDRPWAVALPRDRVEIVRGAIDPPSWRARFASAELRIVTGSRTLLEAIEIGGPFLYFNGILGSGAGQRRHRPEKLIALLDRRRRPGIPVDVRRDLADFARGRRVRPVVRAAASALGGWGRFPRHLGATVFPPPYDDAGHLLVRVAAALARAPRSAEALVARVRAGSPL